MASLSSVGPFTFDPSARTPAASIAAPSGVLSRHCPTELKFSSAKPGGSISRWHEAHVGFFRCSSSCSRTVFGTLDASLLLSSSVGTFGGGGGGGVLRNVLSTYLPR